MNKGWNWALLAAFAPYTLHAAPVPAANPVLQAAASGIRDEAHSRNLGLKRFDVQVTVRGAVAETTIDADFANGSQDLLEGEFRLQLPLAAVVTGYALDVGGRMIDGVLVDAPRAKALYEARVRQRVDPGLAEVSRDNVFSTRIYPIQPGIGRHVRLRFAAPVGPQGLELPLGIDAPAQGWTIAVLVTGAGTRLPMVTAPDGHRLALTKVGDGLLAVAQGKGSPLSGVLRIMPGGLGTALVSQHRSGERYVQLSGDLPMLRQGDTAGLLRVYWDRSRARLKGDLAGDVALLRQVIATARFSAVELVAFNSSGALRTTVTSADAAANWLVKLTYRGASSYAALGKEPPAHQCLLFAQGAPTLDRDAPFSPACRLDAISSAPNADRAWLRHVAQAHGGDAYDSAATGRAALS